MKAVSTKFFYSVGVVALWIVAGVFPALAQVAIQGQWTTLPSLMPINPVHMALLHNGKVLIVSGSGNVPSNTSFAAGLFDPQTGTITTQPLARPSLGGGRHTAIRPVFWTAGHLRL